MDGEDVGEEFAGYILKILGGQDKQGFSMKQGVLTQDRVRLMMRKGEQGCRGYGMRKGEAYRKSVRGCIISHNISVLHLVIVKKGDDEIPGLTDNQIPRRLGPKRASKLRNVLTVAGCDARAYWAGTLLGDLALLVVVGLCFSTVATGAAVWGGAAPAESSAFSLRYTLDEHVSAAVAATPEAVLMMGAAEAAPRVPESLRRSLVDDAVHVDDDAWLGDDALVHSVLDAVVRKYDDPTIGTVLDEVGHHLDDDASLSVSYTHLTLPTKA